MTASLVLVRHGQSEWNKKNLFTGWKNPDLTPGGVEEAIAAGNELKNKNYKFIKCDLNNKNKLNKINVLIFISLL